MSIENDPNVDPAARVDPAVRVEPVTRVERVEPATKSTSGLLSDVMTNVSSLVRNEVDLARAEVSENLNRAKTAIGLLAAAAVIGLVALHVLAAALVAALAELGIEEGWAALIVAVALALIAYLLMKKGTNDLEGSSLAPTRTAKNVQRDAEAVKEAAKNDR